MDTLGLLVMAYPVVMALVWLTGGVYFWYRRERGQAGVDEPPLPADAPLVSVLVPCHDEGANVRETLTAALEQSWPSLEVVAVDDGSTDDTWEQMLALAAEQPRLRVIRLRTNEGKAVALRTAALAARSDILVCVDGDSLLDEHAVAWLASHLLTTARVGAVAGNPRIRNRSTLLGRLQVGEFSAIVGLTRRAQRTYGRVFTVSGAVCAFRRAALHRVGWWSDTAVTEDIDISWRLQRDHWDVRYEPRALCGILTPESVGGLWRQRRRWARGGLQTLVRHAPSLLSWRRRRMWPVLLESVVSIAWALAACAVVAATTVGVLAEGVAAGTPLTDLGVDLGNAVVRWTGVVVAVVCLLQFAVSRRIEAPYEPAGDRTLVWLVWYPLAYWLISMLAAVAAVLTLGWRTPRGRATWSSPDRGLVTAVPAGEPS
ncbi:poly-beta-1,6-N-acetyl-D-glucosamine synthase [Aquipuribacter sp. SD81]|uniref:poly-beta-1,6-N-acetyl-D-glucosamine synthase n=1 Tax=Aquipuribacter sp. SD81 TaxID=3127703 RepID=UPI0030193E7E